jgi:hypothetical protein
MIVIQHLNEFANGGKDGGDINGKYKRESAGANLVAVVCQKAKQEGIAKIYISTYKKGTG